MTTSQTVDQCSPSSGPTVRNSSVSCLLKACGSQSAATAGVTASNESRAAANRTMGTSTSEVVFDLTRIDHVGAQPVAVDGELEADTQYQAPDGVRFETDRRLHDVVIDVVVVAEKVREQREPRRGQHVGAGDPL